MRRTPTTANDVATPPNHGGPCSPAQALKVSQRSHQLCIAAAELVQKTQHMVAASRRLEQLCSELIRDAEMLNARLKRNSEHRANQRPARLRG